MDDYLAKPLESDRLLEMLDRICLQRRAFVAAAFEPAPDGPGEPDGRPSGTGLRRPSTLRACSSAGEWTGNSWRA